MRQLLSYIAQSESEAWVAFTIACTYGGAGSASISKREAFVGLALKSHMMGGSLSQTQYEPVVAIGMKFGAKALIDGAIDRIHKSDYLPLFTYCMDIIYSEGIVKDHEKEILLYIAKVLKITEEYWNMAKQVLYNLNQKNKGYAGKVN